MEIKAYDNLRNPRWCEPRAVLAVPDGTEADLIRRAFERLDIASYCPLDVGLLEGMASRSDTVAAIIDTRGAAGTEMVQLVARTSAHAGVPVGVIVLPGEKGGEYLAVGATAVVSGPLGYGASLKLIRDLAYPISSEEEAAESTEKARLKRIRIAYERTASAEVTQVSGSDVLAERIARMRGKLKIYMGAAPGVGKTFAMLREAHDLVARGAEVVVGVVETHGRAETQDQLARLEVLQKRLIPYKGTQLAEMDLDGIVKRHPAIVLVDELAHTNVPGSLNRKRYQDVELIRLAGISILSTLNIQHLESLNNLIERIAGVKVRETVPDHVLLEADEVALIDLPPEDLQLRLREGKIYAPDKITQALENFFTTHNLTALRELALRELADRVDLRLEEVRTALGRGEKPSGIQERVLACISASPDAGRVIRRAARMAARLNAELTVIHVAGEKSSAEDAKTLDEYLVLAESLDATFVTVKAVDIPEGIARYAQEAQSTVIVLGESHRPRWRKLLEPTIQDGILARTSNIDVLTVASRA
ncbi:MAG: universal stress protein [Cyanobacteria bacterium NC_groundwater_1444_Ag_S-0.65um_54_12]|nr:universal stress protein [Cyanobacteria bacterium NC_groundwater_1444_Ag_S-0.65um_54_12]